MKFCSVGIMVVPSVYIRKRQFDSVTEHRDGTAEWLASGLEIHGDPKGLGFDSSTVRYCFLTIVYDELYAFVA